MCFLQDQIYNNLLNELKTEGAFVNKQVTNKEVKFMIEPLITEETEDNKSAEPQKS